MPDDLNAFENLIRL